MLDDLRFGVRLLAKTPVVTSAAVLTLVIGLLINTAVFGIVNALWFGRLPFRDDFQIVVLSETNRAKGLFGMMSYQDYSDVESASHSFDGMAVLSERPYNISVPGAGGSDRVSGGVMSASALDMLGYRPILGRGLSAEDEGAYNNGTGPPVVLVTESFWRNRLAANPYVVGTELKVNGAPAVIIGVLPRDFRFVYAGYSIIAPLPREILTAPRRDRTLQALARLRSGVTLEQARTELEGISARIAAQHIATNEGWVVRIRPFREAVFGQAKRMYPILMAAAILVLLVVCANVANLLLAKVSARAREMAIRTAVGAPRRRLVQQLLTEGALIAAIGGALALIAAGWMRYLLVAHYPELAVFAIDYRVIAYMLTITGLSAIIFGLGPALAASGGDVNETLKSARPSGRVNIGRLRGALVVVQLALGIMLLGGTGLLVKTIATLRHIETGLDLTNVTITSVALDGPRYAGGAARAQFRTRLAENLAGLPGVQSVAASDSTPLLSMAGPQRLEIAGRTSSASGEFLRLARTVVDANYFATVGMPLVAGRGFAPADLVSNRAAVVNDALARRLHPEAPAASLGERIRVGERNEWWTIMGVVRNARQIMFEPPSPEVFTPMAQTPPDLTIIIRSTGPGNAAEAIRQSVRALDPHLAIGEVLQQPDIVEKFYPKVMIGGLGIFSSVTLALGALGLYGVMAFIVAGTTHELAVRIAIGAKPRSVVAMVLHRAFRLACLGIALGLAGAFGLSRVLAGMLYGASTADPLVFAAITVVFVLVALAASALPALKASRVDPLVALRCE